MIKFQFMKKIFTCIILSFSAVLVTKAQSYQPYSYQFYQKLNSELYNTNTRIHTAIKPMFIDSALQHVYDSVMNYGADSKTHGFAYRKLFNEHLVDVKSQNGTFYADFLPDMTVGKDFGTKDRTVFLTTYGLQIGGSVGDKFAYNVGGYLSWGKFPSYQGYYINQTGIIPGQAYNKWEGSGTKQWAYITANVSYTPVKYLNISAGRDKTFIGDGYRSMLLSDYSSPAPFFKLTGTLGDVRYMAMWSLMNDPQNSRINDNLYNRKKWGMFHYLDWNATNRLSVGFFEGVIAGNEDDAGHKRGFDFTYINPFIFLRPVEASNGSPDNVIIGGNIKYKLTNMITAYAQFSLDEFEGKNFFSGKGSSRNKYGWQFGVKGADLFGVKSLNYLVETNGSRPYTYSERNVVAGVRSSIVSYSNNQEPLAHPWGANFYEFVGILNYSYKRFDFMGELDYGRYGLDQNGINYGKDIFQNYNNIPNQFGNSVGQGLKTDMIFFEGKVAYLLNPKYNLRIELGGTLRNEKNSDFKDNTAMITFGVRSSFRNIYADLASFKTH
jgi:hypothetical protein